MTSAQPPRTGPTEDRLPTPALQLRVRVDWPGTMGVDGPLHFVGELYERRGSKWTRITCRTGPISLDQLTTGESYLQSVKDLCWYLETPPLDPIPDSEDPRP